MTVSPTSRWRLLAIAAALALFGAACGSDADTTEEGTETTEAAETEEETPAEEEAEEEGEEEAAEEEEEGEEEAAEEEAAEEEGEEEAAAEGTPVELNEWNLIAEAPASGTTTFTLSNTGEFPHALAIAKGTSYEELPQLDNGAVDTDTLGDDFLGKSDNVEPGATGSIDFDLEPGDYVFFCPIASGPNSHAAQGQVLSVTVAG